MKLSCWFLFAVGALFFLWASVQASHSQTIVVGDSIALGTGRAMHLPTFARVGAGSCEIARYAFPRSETVMVSAGINDPPGLCLPQLYARFGRAHVLVILPKGINSAREHVMRLAARRGYDTISYRTEGLSFHPRSYPELARAVSARLRGF